MATNDGERYVRLTLLTFEGGKWVSKLIFLREVDALANKPGLNVFLQSHKPHLKLKKNIHELTTRQYKILFPSGGGDTDINDWDLQLLIKLTLDLFKTCLNGQETSDLKEILRIRNEVICHASQPAISDQVFFTQWRLLVGCIHSLSAGQIAEARTIIDKYQCGPILQCHLDNLSALCRNDEHMENVHAALGTVQTSLARFERKQNATSDLILSQMNDIVARLQRIESPKNEQECSTAHVNIPSLKTQLHISGESDEKVKNVEVFVARALEAVMKNVNDPDDDVRVKDALAEMLTVIEGKGGDATAVEQGSVYLHIHCKSISKLRCILEWFLESNNSHQMPQLEAALNGIYGEQFKVCLVLSEESIVKLLDWTVEHVPCTESTSSGELRAKGQVNFGIKCHSSESVMQVVQYFSSGEAANKLNKLSEALSSLVGGTIKVEANVDLDQFLADLKPAPEKIHTREIVHVPQYLPRPESPKSTPKSTTLTHSTGLVDMENRRDLSLRLDEVMDMVGASESMRRLHRRAATTREILHMVAEDILLGKVAIIYQCGSSYEGTVTPDTVSDFDIIKCLTDRSVVTHRLMAGSGARLLVFRDDSTYPGYAKLQLLKDGQPVTDENLRAGDHWGFDRRGRACAKHMLGANMHGPAEMIIDGNGRHLYDSVTALECNSIPPFAAEWIRRRRSHGWPSEQQLDQMRVMRCMVVGTGFYNSPENDFEWRLSFSLQERMLMDSLNIYQHKVYIILKLIKKNILENELHEESLSSYHCKTCIFYMTELTPARMWTQDNLIDCLLECLRLLLKWMRNRFCPSYFIKEQNLFEKEGFERLIEPLQRSVDLILQSGHQFLFMLQSDRIGEILRSGDSRLYRQVSYVRVNGYTFSIKHRVIIYIIYAYKKILISSNCQQDTLSYFTAQLETIQSQERVSSHTPEETKAALSHITPWLHFHIGLEFACRAVTCSTRPDENELMKKVDSHFRQARNTDFANVRLAQASILFRFGKYEECFLLLQEIEAPWSSRVISECCCNYGGTRVPKDQTLHADYPPMRGTSTTKLLKNYFATCVIFLPSQSELVPPPLKYEMFRSLGNPPASGNERIDAWFDWAVVDAKVYLHFMQYLVCSRLAKEPHKKIAMDNLASLIQHADDHELHHKETAYNLLGWIYLQEHRTVDAVQCFIQSWKIRPHHNAAKFHTLNVYRSRVEEQPLNQAGHPLNIAT